MATTAPEMIMFLMIAIVLLSFMMSMLTIAIKLAFAIGIIAMLAVGFVGFVFTGAPLYFFMFILGYWLFKHN
jgi:hypothetical protein